MITSMITTSPAASPAKLRILCLHGFLQNADSFRGKVGSLRKALKSRAELIFVDATHLAPSVDTSELRSAGGTESPRAWWTWQVGFQDSPYSPNSSGWSTAGMQDTEPGMRPSKAHRYCGWEGSRDVLLQVLQDAQPVHGILGVPSCQ